MSNCKKFKPPIYKGALDIKEAEGIMAEIEAPLPYQLYINELDSTVWRHDEEDGTWVCWQELTQILRRD